jgi:hypothetical protein
LLHRNGLRQQGVRVHLVDGGGLAATAPAASLRFSSGDRRWYASHFARLSSGLTLLAWAKLRRARVRCCGDKAAHSAMRLCIRSCSLAGMLW